MEIHQPVLQERPALTVGQHSHDPQIAKMLEGMLHGAVTIAQLVQVSEHVVDSCIVYATAAAAALFGFAHPTELVGQFVSKVHHPDNALVTRQYMLARLHNEWFPNPYPMRILRLPSLEPIPVMKHVKQVMIDGILTWITVHTPFDFSHKFFMPVTPAMIEHAGSATERQLLGLAHVAYMDQMIRSHGREHPRDLARVIESSDAYLAYTPEKGSLHQDLPPKTANVREFPTNVLEALLTAHKKRQRNICVKCGWPWYNKVGTKRPKKCPSCRDKNWDQPYAAERITGRATDKADEQGQAMVRQRARQDTHLVPVHSSSFVPPHFVVGASPAMQALLDQVRRVATTDATVLLLGETGVGKELVARTLHAYSLRRDGPFVAVNCAVLTETLVATELFGHEHGAFTGAERQHIGKVERAHHGTLFLDEVGSLSLPAQAALLRFLQEHTVERVGGEQLWRVDVRVVAATNQELRDLVATGGFRADLFYRLYVVPLHVPPLRARPQDIPLLLQHFLHRYSAAYRRPVPEVTTAALAVLRDFPWPGNVWELEYLVARLVATSDHQVLDAEEVWTVLYLEHLW